MLLNILCIIIGTLFFIISIIQYISKTRSSGLLKKYKMLEGRLLTEDELNIIKTNGISHCTTVKGLEGIKKDNCIHTSSKEKSYSNHNKPCVFFCINGISTAEKGFNQNKKYKKKIIITNLTDSQIKQMKIREYDNAIMYEGNFTFAEENFVKCENIAEIEKYEKSSKDMYYFSYLLNSYLPKVIYIIVSAFICITGVIGMLMKIPNYIINIWTQ